MRIKDALADKGSSYTRASVATSMVVPASRSGYAAVKRVLDWLLSLMALILLFPLFLAVAVAIKLDSRGPVFFVQTRIGKNGKPFSMYKFRSMCVDAEKQLHKFAAMNERDGPVFKIANDPRVTRVGRFIRRTCIDELPQLLNILKGDMGIVGPRPALPNEVAAYTPHQMLRLQATPGLTCYWQIRKDDNTTFAEWVEMDLQYIQDQSFMVDLKIIFAIKRSEESYEILKDNMLPPEIDAETLYHTACENLVRDVEFVIGNTWYGGFGIIADGIHEASALCFKHIWQVCVDKLKDDLLIAVPSKETVLFVPASNEEAVKKLKEDAVNGYHAGTDAISQSLFLFSKDRKELVVYEA